MAVQAVATISRVWGGQAPIETGASIDELKKKTPEGCSQRLRPLEVPN